jgi:hypothetical protein
MLDEFDKLKEQLELQEWPGVYMFKFIVPNTPEKIALVSALFEESVDLRLQPSKTGKYVSVGAKELMLDVDSIIEKYKKASLIEGLIAL